jgi:UDP-N-acetylmuramoyl-tripeptide--D-alanyl-D-alanine ligase
VTARGLWTAAEVAAATGGRCAGTWTASGVSIDSRTLAPGDLFFAVSGPNFDGHDFASEALAAGAAAAVVSRAPPGVGDAAKLVLVEDTLAALGALARVARARTHARVVGVTGSLGKTGTKEMVRAMLAAHGSVHASPGSYNNQFGVPLTLARLAPETDFAVVEMGMNHAGEIAALTRIAEPHVAVVTGVEAVHLEFFGTLQRIAQAKAEIFEGVPDGGAAVLNRDNACYRQLAQAARRHGLDRVIGFGTLPDSAVRLLDYRAAPGRNRIAAQVKGRELSYTLGADGRHWAVNSLAALAAVHALGLDVEAAVKALAGVGNAPGRGARLKLVLPGGRAVTLIDDSYNASPASMRAALEALAAVKVKRGARRFAALGDMLELGPESERLHAGLAPDIAHAGIDVVITVGPFMAALNDALPTSQRGPHAGSAEAVAELLPEVLRDGDALLVKGSHASAMYRVVEALCRLDRSGPNDEPQRAAGGNG